MSFDIDVKLAVYGHFAATGHRPSPEVIAKRVRSDVDSVLEAYRRLGELRVLVLEEDGASVRMASPFSGVPTQHIVESEGVRYFANCGWDALGIAAALHRPATIHSRCEQSGVPLHMEVGPDGPESCDWLFHSLVPVAHWWDDIVLT